MQYYILKWPNIKFSLWNKYQMSSLCKVKWKLLKFTRMVIMTFILSSVFDIIPNMIKYTQTSASLLKFIASLYIFCFFLKCLYKARKVSAMSLYVRGTKPGKWVVMSLCVRDIKPGKWATMSLCVRGIKPGKWAAMSLYVRGIKPGKWAAMLCMLGVSS